MNFTEIQSEFYYDIEQSVTKKYGKFHVNFKIFEETKIENLKDKQKFEI
jgi:hypothetical protein